jgi:hypothetical protein
MCGERTHAGTDVRPIASCLRYGKLAPINNDVIPATKRPNAIHLGCMVNLVGRPLHSYWLAQIGGYERTANRLCSPRIVVLDPNIAVEDVPGQQAFFPCVLASPSQRFKPAVGNAGG